MCKISGVPLLTNLFISGIEIIQIISVDEKTQQIKFKLWTRMEWKNEFSSWDPNKWNSIRSLKIGPEHLWTPDITLYNDIDESQLAGKEKYMKVSFAIILFR